MNETEINIEGFKLIDLLTEEDSDSVKSSKKPDELLGISEAVDLGEVKDLKIIQTDLYGNVVAKYIPKNKKRLGLNPQNYKSVQELSAEILAIPIFTKCADTKFIEACCFDWIIDVYYSKQAKHDLITYIKSRLDKELEDFTFYYKIECLGISEPILIGNVIIDRISQELLDKQYSLQNDKEPLEREEFNKKYIDFFNKPIASVQIRGIKDLAERFARKRVKRALNALKCFLNVESVQSSIQIFDVDFLFHNSSLSNYLFQSSNNNSSLNFGIRQKFGAEPVTINKSILNRINKEGFGKVCGFLEHQATNELGYLIEDSINRLGEIISTRNWHERIVRIISFFESIIVPKSNTKSNGETYLKKYVISKLVKNDSEKLKPMIRRLYETRDKFLHNRILKPIDIHELYKMQKLSLIFLLQLIDLSKKYSTIDEILNYYGIRK